MDTSRSQGIIRASQANLFIAFYAVNAPELSTLERHAVGLEIASKITPWMSSEKELSCQCLNIFSKLNDFLTTCKVIIRMILSV